MLTQREKEILVGISEGKSNKIIAGDLGISKSTVSNILSNIMSKLRAHSRIQAVIIASRKGIIGEEGDTKGMLRQLCKIVDELGLPIEDASTRWSRVEGKGTCGFFSPKLDLSLINCGDKRTPLSNLRICGNCCSYYVEEIKQEEPKFPNLGL